MRVNKHQVGIVLIGVTMLSLVTFGGALVSSEDAAEELTNAGFTKVELIDKKWAMWNWCVKYGSNFTFLMSAEMTFQVQYNNEPVEFVTVCDTFGMDAEFSSPQKETRIRLSELNLK